MNICIIFSTVFPPREGIGNYVYNLAKKYTEKGHDVTLMTRGNIIGKEEYFENIRIFKPVFIPCYPFHVDLHSLFLNKVFKKLESSFDVVHIHMPLSPMMHTKLPIVSTIHTPIKSSIANFESVGFFTSLSKAQAKFSHILEKKVINGSNVLTAVSNSVAQDLSNEYHINKNDIKVIYNGVDEKVFVPSRLTTNKRYILYVGRLSHRKGLFDLIECGKYVCSEHSDINFVIVGEGMLKNELQKKVDMIGLHNKFLFKGHVSKSELISLYQNAMIYVVPSHYEGLPTVLLEAMSCGLPVVATSVSGNVDVVSSGTNGILVPPKSPLEMAKTISILIDDNIARNTLGINARVTIEKKYTWEKVSKNVLQIYRGIL